MRLDSLTRIQLTAPAILVIGACLVVAACTSDTGTMPTSAKTYNQEQRLGNPLVSEVLLSKRSHSTHGSIGPDQDLALIGAEAAGFVTGVAGRSQATANTLASVLLPDMLIIDTSKDPTTDPVGWLTWALASGWGGRQLADDVVDGALSAVFGALVDPNNTTPELTSDNVACGNCASGPEPTKFKATFPYLADPN